MRLPALRAIAMRSNSPRGIDERSASYSPLPVCYCCGRSDLLLATAHWSTGELVVAEEAAAGARDDVERARKESRERGQELEKLRQQLQEARSKLKKAQAANEPRQQPSKRRRGPEPRSPEPEIEVSPSQGSAAQVVHVSSLELEAAHRKELDGLNEALTSAQR